MNPQKHKTPIQIRFKDVDRLGHVNNANHITYFELARVDYFNVLMGDLKIDWDSESLILAKMEMEYKQPILLNDKIFVYTWVSRIGSKSFDMNCTIIKEENGVETLLANGLAVIVCFNYKTQQTILIPETWKTKMTK